MTQKNASYSVVLGVSGGLGAAVARELVSQNKSVIGINRSGTINPLLVPEEVEVRGIDIWDRGNILPILRDAETIYHCINLPYSKWVDEFLELTKYIVSLVEEVQVPLVVSDNLYMYGEVMDEPRHENMPYNAKNRKGQVRAQMANYYQQAHDEGRIKMVMVRGPSYYGAGSLYTSHYGDRLFVNVLKDKRAMFVGNPDVKHTTIHLGDFARAMILLGNDPDAYGQAWHAPCPPAMTKSEFAAIAYQLAGFEPIKPRSLGKTILTFAGLFDKNIAEVKEMLYEFEHPYYVDHSKFMDRYPDFKITPIEEGIQEAVEWYEMYFSAQKAIAK